MRPSRRAISRAPTPAATRRTAVQTAIGAHRTRGSSARCAGAQSPPAARIAPSPDPPAARASAHASPRTLALEKRRSLAGRARWGSADAHMLSAFLSKRPARRGRHRPWVASLPADKRGHPKLSVQGPYTAVCPAPRGFTKRENRFYAPHDAGSGCRASSRIRRAGPEASADTHHCQNCSRA